MGAALPIVSVAASVWLMLNLPAETWVRFGIWMAIGFVVYFLYSRTHSRMAKGRTRRHRRPDRPAVRGPVLPA